MNNREEIRIKNNHIAIEFAVNETLSRLKNDGYSSITLDNIRDKIYLIILNNCPFQDLSDLLISSLYPSDSYINLIREEITPDAFNCYNGILQEQLRIKYKSTKFRYMNDLVGDSRPFCIHMRETFGSRDITVEELQKVLDEYCPNGIPSDELITINNECVKNKKIKKGFGMKQNTVLSTFSMYRGGYGCHHVVRWDLTSGLK